MCLSLKDNVERKKEIMPILTCVSNEFQINLALLNYYSLNHQRNFEYYNEGR